MTVWGLGRGVKMNAPGKLNPFNPAVNSLASLASFSREGERNKSEKGSGCRRRAVSPCPAPTQPTPKGIPLALRRPTRGRPRLVQGGIERRNDGASTFLPIHPPTQNFHRRGGALCEMEGRPMPNRGKTAMSYHLGELNWTQQVKPTLLYGFRQRMMKTPRARHCHQFSGFDRASGCWAMLRE